MVIRKNNQFIWCTSNWCLAIALTIAPCISPAHTSFTEIEVVGNYDNSVGSSDSASQGVINSQIIENSPLLRPGEMLEYVPGMVVTQHSGDGKANQYFLRGFNLDHGTDFSTFINGVPANMPTNAHGQGYADINYLIPELVDQIQYRKGPYFVGDGDFSSAGSADVRYKNKLDNNLYQLTVGSFGYRRNLIAGSLELHKDPQQMESGLIPDGPILTSALETLENNGPWTHPEDLRKANVFSRLSNGTRAKGCAPTLISADVPVAGFGFVGGDAQDDDVAFLGLGNGLLHGGCECRWVGNGLVCGGDDQHGVLAVLHGGQGCQSQGRGGVAAHGLEQGAAQGNSHFAQLLGCQKAVLFAADDDGGSHFNVLTAQSGQSLRGLLKQAVVTCEAKKLLGEPSSRERPQACAGAAAEDDRGDLCHPFCVLSCPGASTSDLSAAISKLSASYSSILRLRNRVVRATFSAMPMGVSKYTYLNLFLLLEKFCIFTRPLSMRALRQ